MALSGGVTDLEVYNAAGSRVTQKYWTSQNFAANQTLSYSTSWSSRTTACVR